MNEPAIDSERARELLGRERKRIETALARSARVHESATEEIDTGTDPDDDAGVITEEEVDDALGAQLRDELAAVEGAEARLDDGTYGLSVESGEQIPAERLEAIPWAERTAAEQARREGRK